jgi:hypothetical protein
LPYSPVRKLDLDLVIGSKPIRHSIAAVHFTAKSLRAAFFKRFAITAIRLIAFKQDPRCDGERFTSYFLLKPEIHAGLGTRIGKGYASRRNSQ